MSENGEYSANDSRHLESLYATSRSTCFLHVDDGRSELQKFIFGRRIFTVSDP
jgi:hypothetical protein